MCIKRPTVKLSGFSEVNGLQTQMCEDTLYVEYQLKSCETSLAMLLCHYLDYSDQTLKLNIMY